ncbi:M14 family metallocarboxypeptidase [Shewanella sp. JM162201]|uniref:M14 family metallocarboxypeptidase n=1 Tax=Shewanella jiangmenensis TaxID=2837387 RepID=A0ABS5V7R1_9GAMM|nr:M14 family metallocarboxypeptidase [Shewanella jiangmenensis]MBT1446474.1 M14 family metallocarboxypeptidase [Shewanella jiangmenensis]
MTTPYPIGTPGTPWTDSEKTAWFQAQTVKRSYREEVLSRILPLGERFTLERYGALSIAPDEFPLYAVKNQWQDGLPLALVTGGVHGYETSGVQGALDFLHHHADDYAGKVNLLIAPCISPWAYEIINRWNPKAVDPNRSFVPDSPSEESAALLALVAPVKDKVLMHIDLHETTDSDESEFRPALAARDGKAYEPDIIPDGFYLVGDSENPQEGFQKAIIDAVEKVTHIAPPDDKGNIIGSLVVQHGVINYPVKALGLCAGITNARFTTTTEVYPDSPKATAEECNAAQVAAIRAALDYMLAHQ